MDQYRVTPGSAVRLTEHDPRDRSAFDGSKREGRARLSELTGRLRSLQRLLYAEGRHRVLVVLQAIDTGGKDGTIRHVFTGVNPQGVRVTSFKRPTARELAHDYLWRVHPHVPGNGEIAIFNRSHYEDVIAVRVRGLAPDEVWERRYDHINDFERMLADEGTTILKFFLHISKEEQAERLQRRITDPDRRWKFDAGDLDDRALWDDYASAFEAVLERTSTEWAPWHVVPADRKWYRNLVVGTVLTSTLESLDMSFPEPAADLSDIVID